MNGQPDEKPVPHYYGDIVRYLFILAAVIMLIGLPALREYLNVPTGFSVISILILGLSAGLTNPLQTWVAVVNSALSAIGLVVFETHAVGAYRDFGSGSKFFVANIVLGLIFLVAVYYSVKTLRGLLLKK